MIKAVNLTKKYGVHTAIDNLNFHIGKGEIIGFLGPNGAGKSTTMNIITGYLSATSGDIYVDGLNVLEYPNEIKKKIGYLPESPPIYEDMTVNEYLKFVSQIKKVPKEEMNKDLDKITELVEIRNERKRLIKNLSKGYKQRVGLAQALVGNPKLLILDEPTVGLDPKQIIGIRSLIQDLSKDHTIVLSSHILHEVSAVCQRLLIINKGKIVATDSPQNLAKGLTGSNRLFLKIEGSAEKLKKSLDSIKEINKKLIKKALIDNNHEVIIESEKGTDIRKKIFSVMAKENLPILEMRPKDMTLEEIFLELTTNDREE